jgi:serine/threonine protein kinase
MTELYDNKYRFEKELGKGGFGRVFLAREEVSNRLVAIKQLNNTDIEQQEKIIYEIQVIAKFNHPNIVTYHHHFSQNGLLFLVMEYCAGGSLQDKLNGGKIDAVNTMIWMQILAEAFEFVHDKGIIHHDIKPLNILFTENGTIKISDFGVANTGAGTRAFMSPEALDWDRKSITDARVDIYALGVSLMMLLSGANPFYYLSREEIIALHDKGDFPIKKLANWQQEIILRSINKVPELRFQTMKDFAEGIKAKQVPLVLNRNIIKAGELAEKADKLLSTKKWLKAGALLEFAEEQYPNNVNVIRVLGKYYLMQQRIDRARSCYEKALKLNSRLDVQKDLGWINLAQHNYPTAISLLSDHLHRNPSDYEAYNLLLQCFYETNRYEAGMDLAKTLLDINANNPCFANNYYICSAMHNIGQTVKPHTVLKTQINEFVDYNYSVIIESQPTHGMNQSPTLKSKLLFMDYRFQKMVANNLHFVQSNIPDGKFGLIENSIIKFGRKGFDVNDIEIPGGTSISRRHCLIINCKDDVWLYDLNSTGTYVNNDLVKDKVPLIGLNTIRIGKVEYQITTDKDKLL